MVKNLDAWELIMSLKKRLDTYFELSSSLALLGPKELTKLLSDNTASRGWGVNHVITLSGKKIFVKRVPLTQREFELPFSTKNIFNLPPFYNYGVGSAGFGSFRELAAHMKTTNWVLNGECSNFPLMYHYRILKKSEKAKPIDKVAHRAYVKRWNSDKNIDRYILARKRAPYEIVLFLEYFPFNAYTWILKNTDQSGILVRDIKKVTNFLKTKDFMHFDLHLANVLLDGKNAYLTDFGLCLDRSFELSARERRFFELHFARNYDYNSFLGALGYSLYSLYDQLPVAKKNKVAKGLGFSSSAPAMEVLPLLFRNLKTIREKKLLKADDKFLNFLGKNQKEISAIRDFYMKQRQNPKKNTPYPDLSLV